MIDAVITIDRDDFEIVITDNQSTDGTRDVITGYSDSRVRYCENAEPLPALLNTIRSIYNARRKYALYCNDRDLLFPENIGKLLKFLENKELSFVHNSKFGEGTVEYKKGFDSLFHQDLCRHPSGMVFNRRIIEKYIDEDSFQKHLASIYTYDFLMIDLLSYENSALVDLQYWGKRPIEYIRSHRAGTGNNYYFLPENREKTFYAYFDYIFENDRFALSENEQLLLSKRIYGKFCKLFCNYKLCMSDMNETAHYGLDRQFISTRKMLRIYCDYYARSIHYFQHQSYALSFIAEIPKWKHSCCFKVLKCCLKIEVLNALKLLNRFCSK